MRNEIAFTDEEIEAHFDEQTAIFGAIDDITYTRETLEALVEARQNWNVCGTLEHDTLGGFPAVIVRGAQAFKGQPRHDLVVIDYGTVRAVLQA